MANCGSRTLFSLLVPCVVACGATPPNGVESSTAADAEATSDGTSGSAASGGDASTGDASTGDGDGDGATTGDGDGTASAGDGDGTASTGDGDGDGTSGDGDVTFEAHALVGALDRIVVIRRDPVANQCASFRLVSPASAVNPITAPPGWGYESGAVMDGAAGCDPWNPMALPTATATDASGWADFADPGAAIYPCVVSFDVTLEFAGAPAWAPATVALTATDVPVQGACP